MTTGASVTLESVGFRYPNGVQAVQDLSLHVEPDSTAAIIGPSGCGKSTILSLVAGLTQTSAGHLTLDGEGGSAERLQTTMVFQKDTLLPWLTVRENVLLHQRFGRSRRRGRRERRSGRDGRAAELLALARLSDFADSFPYELSGGMRRRVAFLTGVAPLPSLLLLDEPFSALDEPSRIALHQDAHDIVRSSGITTMLVTHDLAEAISLADRIYILTNRPASVFTQYDVPFGRERDIMSLREDPVFLELYGTLWRDLHTQIDAGRAA